MPDPVLLTDRAQVLLEMIPPWFRDDPDVLGVFYAAARLFEEVDGDLGELLLSLASVQPTLLLDSWETLLGLPVDPLRSLDQRRAAIGLAFRRMIPDPSGLRWKQDMDLIMPDGWTYQEHIPGDPSSPAEDTIRLSVLTSPDTPSAAALLKIVRDSIPANLAIEVDYEEGFQMDLSPMDSQTWYELS